MYKLHRCYTMRYAEQRGGIIGGEKRGVPSLLFAEQARVSGIVGDERWQTAEGSPHTPCRLTESLADRQTASWLNGSGSSNGA
jgi:hypothetical protein